jgi:beta-barrel assembly-enhancing protease
MKRRRYLGYGCLFASLLLVASCSKEGGGINLISLDQEKQMGLQMETQISSDPTNYPLLDKTTHQAAYSGMERIKNTILTTGKVDHKDDFVWSMHIIKDDKTLNAFATPGGYIYVYTGLIKYLDTESELAGVLGHEMAHAARRHSTKQLTKQYGIELLLSIILGNNPGELAKIVGGLAGNLVGLEFSREDEYEADKYSVIYLSNTDYDPQGVAGFFIKLEASNQAGNTPAFLSTHPSPSDRIEKITEEWKSQGSKTGNVQQFVSTYKAIKDDLP